MTAGPPGKVTCPMCGCENDPQHAGCSVCGYVLIPSQTNAGGTKCARCGSQVPPGYPFCPVCGLDQRQRLPRPPTGIVKISDEDDGEPGVEPPAPEPPPAVAAAWGSAPDGSSTPAAQTGRTIFVDGPPVPRPPSPDEPFPAAETLDGASSHAAHISTPSFRPDAIVPAHTAHVVLIGRDGEEGDRYPMQRGTLTIGRTEGDIRFPEDAFMSPSHGEVRYSGSTYTLVDHGSANGVFLRIRDLTPVYPGDRFMVGHQVLQLENVTESAQEQPPGPDGTRAFGTPLKPAWGKLVLVGRGCVPGNVYFLRGAKVVFGREQGDIVFPKDPFVSREHARLRLEVRGAQMSVFLEDLDSANGTYIRIRGHTPVQSRDTFRMGDQILRLRLDHDPV